MEELKISIIIPTYKRSDKIGKAIESTINQNYDNYEIIVVDDNDPNSKDRQLTEEVLEKYKNQSNLKYIKHDKNRNGSAARNTGIKNSTGDFITFLDDDDEYYPDKLKDQAMLLESLDETWGLVYSSYDKENSDGTLVTSSEKAEGYLLTQVLSKNLFIGSGSNFMVRRSVVEELSGFDENFKRNQDIEFLVRVAKKYKIKHLDKPLFLIHSEPNIKRFTYDEIINVYNYYRHNFSSEIDSLTVSERRNVLKVLDLWDIRLALSHKKFKEAFYFYNNSSLSIRDIYKYSLYFVDRYINKTSYGFVL